MKFSTPSKYNWKPQDRATWVGGVKDRICNAEAILIQCYRSEVINCNAGKDQQLLCSNRQFGKAWLHKQITFNSFSEMTCRSHPSTHIHRGRNATLKQPHVAHLDWTNMHPKEPFNRRTHRANRRYKTRRSKTRQATKNRQSHKKHKISKTHASWTAFDFTIKKQTVHTRSEC